MSIRTRSSVLALLALATLLCRVARSEEPASGARLAELRERFHHGLEGYRAGDMARAIRTWEPLLAELGPEEGYRVAFDLARAYETSGEFTKAAERFRLFLGVARARVGRGEAVPAVVSEEVETAKARLAAFDSTLGRIEVLACSDAVVIAVDHDDPRSCGAPVYVAPGSHVVLVRDGAAEREERVVEVRAGERVALSLARRPVVPRDADVRPSPRGAESRVVAEHPISAAWIWAGSALTAASLVVPALAYDRASALHAQYSPPHAATPDEQQGYAQARSLAYASWALPGVLAAATGGVALFYALGVKSRVVPLLAASPSSAALVAAVRY